MEQNILDKSSVLVLNGTEPGKASTAPGGGPKSMENCSEVIPKKKKKKNKGKKNRRGELRAVRSSDSVRSKGIPYIPDSSAKDSPQHKSSIAARFSAFLSTLNSPGGGYSMFPSPSFTSERHEAFPSPMNQETQQLPIAPTSNLNSSKGISQNEIAHFTGASVKQDLNRTSVLDVDERTSCSFTSRPMSECFFEGHQGGSTKRSRAASPHSAGGRESPPIKMCRPQLPPRSCSGDHDPPRPEDLYDPGLPSPPTSYADPHPRNGRYSPSTLNAHKEGNHFPDGPDVINVSHSSDRSSRSQENFGSSSPFSKYYLHNRPPSPPPDLNNSGDNALLYHASFERNPREPLSTDDRRQSRVSPRYYYEDLQGSSQYIWHHSSARSTSLIDIYSSSQYFSSDPQSSIGASFRLPSSSQSRYDNENIREDPPLPCHPKERNRAQTSRPEPRMPRPSKSRNKGGILKASIYLPGYPGKTLTNQQGELVRQSLIKKAFSLGPDDFYPHISAHYIEKGVLTLHCDDNQTRDWVIRAAPELKPWDGATLKACNTSRLIGKATLRMNLPRWYNDLKENDILKALEGANTARPELELDQWKILSIQANASGGRSFVVRAPHAAASALKINEKVWLGLNCISIAVLKDVGSAGNSDEDEPS